MGPDIVPGTTFPDYELPDHTDTPRKLSQIQGDDPMILTLAREYTDPENDPMIPHTLVLEPGLVVHKIYNGYWFWGRPSAFDLWRDLRAVSSKVRPDWDLSTPGLREAWSDVDYSFLHGWDRLSSEPLPAT